MKKKLYIPTSSLNFNNIISSESIAPSSFYLKRGYGFKRLEKVSLNHLDNVILLYEQYPDYEIGDKELENYPMVIEICRDFDYANLKEVGEGIYTCSKTIYLNPFDSKFYFNSEFELKSTISKAEPSIEAKLVHLYENCSCMCIADKAEKRENYKNTKIQDEELNEEALEDDIRIDKLKGFLYAYIIASNRSCDPNIASLKMHFKELLNSLSAIITFPNFSLYDLKSSEGVSKLYRLIRQDIERIEGITDRVKSIIQEKKKCYNIENLDEFLKKEGLYEDVYKMWYANIKKSEGLSAKNSIEKFSVTSTDNKIEMLEDYGEYLTSFANKIQKKVEPFSVDNIPTISDDTISNIPGCEPFIVKLLNLYLSELIQKNSFLGNRYDYALKGCTLFSESLGEKWNGSEERIYINSLLNNLKDYTDFSINSTKNQTLKSFAAFFKMGDVEIEKVEDYLVANGIGDLRIAFALWGVVFGFSEMPKTITKDLLDSDDVKYRTNIYKGIYNALFNTKLPGELCSTSSVIGYKSGDTVEILVSTTSEVSEDLNKIFNSKPFSELSESAQKWYREKALNIWKKYQKNTKEFRNELLSLNDECKIAKTKGPWEQCVKLIEPPKPKRAKKTRDSGPELFDSNEVKSSNITRTQDSHLIRTLNVTKQFSEAQIKRLIKNWDYTGENYVNEPAEHLKFFINLCKKESRGEKWNKELINSFNDDIAQRFYDEIAIRLNIKWKKRLV